MVVVVDHRSMEWSMTREVVGNELLAEDEACDNEYRNVVERRLREEVDRLVVVQPAQGFLNSESTG